ncbi:MAG: hypothetical protein E7063_05120 [Spirochaetaceae bacterium]|nr:hypothetical protein [Spirochaetaceae bacterium]
MTLNTRNKSLIGIFIFSIILLLGISAIVIISMVKGKFSMPMTVDRMINFSWEVPIFQYNPIPSFAASVMMLFYAIILVCVVFINFEKTQSSEIIYFSLFLVGVVIESVRILFPAWNIWGTYSKIYILLGHVVVFGKILQVLSLILMPMLSFTAKAIQNTERNLLVILASSWILTWVTPIDTGIIPSNCSIRFGYEGSFMLITLFCFIASFFSFVLHSETSMSIEFKKMAWGYLSLVLGSMLMNQADCFFILGVGCILLILGSVLFLSNLHKYYMWK